MGNDLLLLPSVTVLVRDDDRRLLLVRQADSGRWGTIDVELGAVLAVLGGPEFRVRYANGDEAAYVSIVFDARTVTDRAIHPEDEDEILEVRWFSPADLPEVDLHDFARASLVALGLLPSA